VNPVTSTYCPPCDAARASVSYHKNIYT
jgi:hypothetical protein